jgi:hypothetical protein
MDKGIVSSDEKQHLRPGKSGSFRGLIGIVLWVKNPSDFKERYNKMLESFFKRFKVYRKRQVYKSSEIGALFPGDREKILRAYRTLAHWLVRIPDLEINVYYLTLDLAELRARLAEGDSKKIEDLEKQKDAAKLITIYGERGKDAAQLVSVTDFMAKVREYFPIICACKLCTYLDLWDAHVILDGCKGERSHAWEDLVKKSNDFTIAFGGDLYNPFVSSSDLLVKWIDEELRQSGLPLNQNALERVLREWAEVTKDLDTKHIHVVHVSNQDLQFIQPLSKERIDAFEHTYARHPIFFIFREEINEKQRKAIEDSPRMNRILDLIFEKDGSLLWWDPHIYTKVIADGDVALVFGPNGEKEARFLIEAGAYPLKILQAKDI